MRLNLAPAETEIMRQYYAVRIEDLKDKLVHAEDFAEVRLIQGRIREVQAHLSDLSPPKRWEMEEVVGTVAY